MKRIVSIALLGILLFNWVGFRFFSTYMEQQANNILESRLDDDNYDAADLISIKVPAGHLTAYTLSNQFERVNGQVEVAGVQYKYVKRRLFNDSLELLCIPNQQGMQLQNAKDDFFKLVNDLQHNGQGKKGESHPAPSKNISTDYYKVDDLLLVNPINIATAIKPVPFSESLSDMFTLTGEQPPELC